MSDFSAKIHEKRHQLTTQLVAKLLGLQPEDENFSLAHDFCLQKEYYHSFGDVNPSAVEAYYAELAQRLQEDSQPSKAAALSALTCSLLGSDLAADDTPELNHKLLQLLASLAGQPLDSTLEETPQLLQLLYQPAEQQQQQQQQQPRQQRQQRQQQQVTAVSRFRQLLWGGKAAAADAVSEDAASTAGTSSEDEYDPYADESDLSSWEPDDEQQQQQLRQTAAAQQGAGDDAAAEAGQLQPDTSSSSAPALAVYRPAAALQAPRQLQPGRATPGRHQLLGRLAAARPAQLQAMWPDRGCCFSEQYLAQQLLRVLQGQQAHGFLLQAEQQAGAALLAADSRATTPVLSQGSLQALLAEFAEAGSAARQLGRLAAQLTRSRGRPWLLSSSSSAAEAAPQAAAGGGTECGIAGVPATSCLRAFGVALQQQLHLMGQQLAALQSTGVAAAGTNSSSALAQQPALTLLLVKQRTRPIVRRLQLLHNTVEPVLKNLGGCPADASAALLDGLQEAASAAALTASGEQGVADAAALLHLLLCSCVPLVAALSQWLWSAADGAAPDDSQLAALPPADTAAAGSRRSSADAADAQQQEQQQQQQPQGVSCCCEDFFIVKHAAVAATDACFWHAAYGFSQRRTAPCNSSSEPAADTALGSAVAGSTGAMEPGAEAAVACPAFLQPLAGSIMTAGKSVRLLDYMEQEELRRTSFCSKSSNSKSSSNGVVRAASGAWLGVAAARGSSKSAWQLARSRSAGAATQHLGRQPDSFSGGVGSSSRQPFGKARSSSMGGGRAAGPAAAAAAAGSRGRTHRRQWSSTGAAAAPVAASQQPGLSLSNFTKQVRLQLAVAAAVAGRSEQDQLPQQFIAAASKLLQRQQPDAHLAAAAGPVGKQAAGTAVSAGELMRRVLQAAGQQLSQPCAHPSEAALGQQQHAAVSLRDALLAAKAQRAALTSSNKGSAGTPPKQQPTPAEQQQASIKEQQAHHNTEQAQPEQQQEATQQQQPSADEACPGDDPAQAADSPAAEDTSAGGSSGPIAEAAAAAAAAESAPDVPRLLQWRDQLDARLAVTGSCLKHMAPWQQQQQQHGKLSEASSTCAPDALQPAARDASGAARGSLLLPAAGSAMPGSFSASLAGLWPLQQPLNAHRSAAAAIKQWGAASCSSSADDQQQQRLSWLTGGCPGEELVWLLLEPPRSLPPLPQLLEQALLAPIQERLELVGARLLGSLMGEWGLLHQLQGLVAVSLLASPTMVEWCEAAFAAAEAALEAKRQHNKKARPGSPGKDRAAAAGARLAAGGGVGGGPSVVLGADELDVVELELLLQDLVSAADCPENPLPDPACLHLSINVAALAELRTAKQKQLQEGGSQAAIGAAAAAATAAAAAVGAASAAATGGLWGCAGEWAGLSCRHSGSWQLSLLYNPEELARFSTAWRFLVQLRWVRRRLDAARHGACKGTAARHGACKGAAARRGASKGAAARHDAAGQDAREEAAVAAAMRAAAASRGLAHSRAAEPGSSGSAAPKWLSGRQELLLLQEMGQMMARWQQYIMDRLLRAALPALLQALCSAGSLDEVRSAAGAFLATVCNLCNARPSGKGAGGTWQHIGRVLARLMDRCLAAAAAAARLQELRQMLDQPGLEPAEAQRSWLELCGLRARLAAVSGDWRGDVGYLLRILKMRSTTLGDADDLEALLGCLDANGYWQRLAGHQLAAAR